MTRLRLVLCATALAVSGAAAQPGTAAPPDAAWVVTHQGASWAFGSGGMSAFADGTAYALFLDLAPGRGGLLRSRDFGETWERRAVNAHGLGLQKLAMSSPTTGFALGLPARGPEEPQASPYDGGLLRTGDAMRSWSRHPIPRPVGARYFHTYSLRSSPSGRSAVFTGSVRTLPVGFLDPGAEVVFASDSGRTMRRARLGNGTGVWAVPVLADDRTAVVAVREHLPALGMWVPRTPCCGYRTVLWATRDAGRTWQRHAVLDDEVMSLDWVAGRLMLASARHGTVFVSRDLARTVTPVGAVRLLPPGASDDGTHPRSSRSTSWTTGAGSRRPARRACGARATAAARGTWSRRRTTVTSTPTRSAPPTASRRRRSTTRSRGSTRACWRGGRSSATDA